MADMSKFKKTTPGQDSHRRQWILDVVRENQAIVSELLCDIAYGESGVPSAKQILSGMHKNDRDALLQEGGILYPDQIEMLK